MKIMKLALVSTFLVTLTGCASIFGTNSRAVEVKSNPSGATIYVDNKQYGVTPAVITLPNYIYGGKAIVLRKRGYEEQTAMVNTQFQPVTLLDIFLWPTFIIDAAAGNVVRIDPGTTNLNYNLQKS
jgi:hypothetical protein